MIDPMGLDLGLGPAPTAPEPPQPASRTPSGNQRLVQLALMGLAGGLGPGAGTGILQGMTAAMQRRRQDAAQQDAFAQQQYARQQQEYAATMRAYEVEQQRREQVLQKNLQDFRTVAPTLPDKGAYDRYVDAYTQGLQALGFRLSPNWLRSAVPYTAPTAKDVAAKALDAFMKNPLNKSVVDNPDKLSGAFLTFDRDGDGVPEQVPFFEAAELAQMPVAKDASGKLLAMPKGTTPEVKANADGILQSLIEQDRAEGKPDTPQRRVELQRRAIRLAKQAGDTTPNAPATPDAKRPEQIFVLRNGVVTPIEKGTAQPGDRPYNAADAKMQATAQDVASKRRTLAENAIAAIDALQPRTAAGLAGDAPGFRGIFGAPSVFEPGSLTRAVGMDPVAGTTSADAKAALQRLLSLITLPELQNMRGLGAMSDREFATISAAATTLTTRMSERAARAELARLRKAFEDMRDTMSGTPVGDIGAGSNTITVGGQTFGVQVVD